MYQRHLLRMRPGTGLQVHVQPVCTFLPRITRIFTNNFFFVSIREIRGGILFYDALVLERFGAEI